jgi:hypothetical protein
MKQALWLAVWLAASAAMSAFAQGSSARLGDRLVVSINNLPYTHRQIEAYATVREALRPGDGGTRVAVVAANWKDAIDVFTEEMIILQEAQRLGGFQADSKIAARFQLVLAERMQAGVTARATLDRLGYDAVGIARVVDAILRVATFRRSKERQPGGDKGAVQEDGPPAPASAPGGGGGPWLDELKARAVVRHYDEAFNYVMIQPPQRKKATGG